MFTSARTPHPQAFEVQKVYQNVSIKPVQLTTNSFTIENRFDYTNLKNYVISWKIVGDGVEVANGSLGELVIEPHSKIEISIKYPDFTINPGTEYFLLFEVKTKNASQLLKKDYRIAWEQYKLPFFKEVAKSDFPSIAFLKNTNTDSTFQLESTNSMVTFNTKTGFVSSFKVQGNEVLVDGLVPNFWRSATDNDIGTSAQIRCAMWQHPEKDIQLKSFKVLSIKGNSNTHNSYTVVVNYFLPQVQAEYILTYLFNTTGDLKVKVEMKGGNKPMPELPRFGLRVLLKNEFDQTSWLGCGPLDNYCDRNSSSPVGVYSMPVDSLFYPYPRAQESGNRTNVRWMSMCNKAGVGLMAIGNNLSTGAVHFDMHLMDWDRFNKKNLHGGSMEKGDYIWWNIDYLQMGLGGDNSWGAKAHSEYLIPYMNYEYSFILRPVVSGSNLNLNSVSKIIY